MTDVKNLFDLTNQIALITGGASGLGYYYTQALVEAGADVCIVSRSTDGWETTRAYVESHGHRVEFMQQDITVVGAAAKIIDHCVNVFGRLDILVNNAGIQIRNNLLDFADADWLKVIDTNLNALYFLAHEAARVMIPQHSGKIINIGSMQSFRAGKFIYPYAASKHGVIGLTKAYADGLAPEGIQVNVLAPGYINTEMTKPLQADVSRNAEILAHIPAGHWADPSELKGAIVFLASAASNYISGATIPVDGGYLLR